MKTLLIPVLFIINFLKTYTMNLAVDLKEIENKEFVTMLKDIDDFLIKKRGFRATALRLAFHDCISGCNGCINMKNPDNKGLKGIIRQSERIYDKYMDSKFYGRATPLSRSDFWTIMSYRAVYITSKCKRCSQPVLDFKFGRTDCEAGAQLDEMEILPDALGNWDMVRKTFNRFNYTDEEIITLMGAHTLGRARPNNLGFRGQWKLPALDFNSGYYEALLNHDLNWVFVETGKGRFQWNATKDYCNMTDATNIRPRNNKPCKKRGCPRFMLNADMALYKQFETDENGHPSCTYHSCKTHHEEQIMDYAINEKKFKQDFGPVYVRMTEQGYQGVCDLQDPINPCEKK